jgi:cytochrome c peroxidase
MSTAVLHALDRRVADDPGLARDVTLVTVSFDPARDTPDRLAAMQKMRAEGSSWQFTTAADDASLRALLADFGQDVTLLRNPDGSPSGKFRHVLKVYPLDRSRRVRNIDSVGYLSPDLVMADLQTLRMLPEH